MRSVRHLPSCALLLGWLLACGEPGPGEEARKAGSAAVGGAAGFSEPQLALLESLSLASLGPPPPDPSNGVSDLPAAAELGHRLFFDARLSRNGRIACASCHLPELLFTDGRTTSQGLAATSRNAPTLVGAAWSPWMFWDGRRDSLWAQALGPLETAAEMGTTRAAAVGLVARDPGYRAAYEQAFGELPAWLGSERLPASAGPFGDVNEQAAWHRLPERDRVTVDRVFSNLGKAIAAYERLLRPGPSRFDRWVAGLRDGSTGDLLDEEELRGVRLFMDAERTLCLRCHNGPLLTNHGFHRIGTAQGDLLPDFGRFLGIQAVLIDPFNCLGPFSDAPPESCDEIRFLDKAHVGDEMGKFKTPTLRGLPRTAPYMHDGRFETLSQVMDHYREAPARAGDSEITRLTLDDEEIRALVAFLETLDGPVDAEPRWLGPPPGPQPRPLAATSRR